MGKQRKRMSETSSKWKKEKLIFSGEKSLKYVDINPLEVSESRSPSDLVRNFGSLEDSKAKIVENFSREKRDKSESESAPNSDLYETKPSTITKTKKLNDKFAEKKIKLLPSSSPLPSPSPSPSLPLLL